MRDPIYDLIIGNLPGMMDAEGSSEKVSTDPEELVMEPTISGGTGSDD